MKKIMEMASEYGLYLIQTTTKHNLNFRKIYETTRGGVSTRWLIVGESFACAGYAAVSVFRNPNLDFVETHNSLGIQREDILKMVARNRCESAVCILIDAEGKQIVSGQYRWRHSS
jgi:hypothetical protein